MATTPARSLDLGRVLSTGFSALFNNAVPFLAVSAVLAGIPGFIFSYWMLGVATADTPPSVEYIMSRQFWGPILGGAVAWVVSSALLQGTLISATVRHLSGRPAHIEQSVAGALARVVSIILLSLLVAVVVGFGFLLLIVPGVIFYLMYVVAVPVMMAEGRGITESMSRSAELTKGSRPMIFLLVIVMGMVTSGGSAVSNAIFARLIEVGGDAGMDRITMAIGTLVEQTAATAVGAVLIAALYVELRAIKEGATPEGISDVFA